MSFIPEILKQGEAAKLSSEEISRLIQLAVEREERAAAREVEKEKAEREEREKQRAHELAMAEAQNQTTARGILQPSEESVRPRIPPFRDGEDMDAYLTRFEKVAKFHHWKDEDLALHLGSLLKGKALKEYVGLPSEISEDYQMLKLALLKAFHADVDSYRKQFRGMKVQGDESYLQFVSRLEQTLKRWLALSEVAEDYKSLFDFVVRDQFLTSCSPEVKVFLREKGSVPNAALAKAADIYRSAHGTKPVKPSKPDGRNDAGKERSSHGSSDGQSKGHYVPKCYLCGKRGHRKPDCPQLATKGESAKVNFVFDSELKPDGAVVDPNGTVNKHRAEVTLDTGCSTVIIHPKFLSDSVRQGPICTVYDYLGRSQRFPTVVVQLNCKFFSGTVRAVVAPLKFSDVLLGRVPGLIVPSFTVGVAAQTSNEPSVAAVVTRAAAMKTLTPSSLPSTELDIPTDKQSFKTSQGECVTLKAVWDAHKQKRKVTHHGRTVKYEIINDLLYRVCVESKDETEVGEKQLVVPKQYRSQIMKIAHESLMAGHFSHRKTAGKIYRQFYWPGVGADIERFCKSCDTCQRVTQRGRVKPVPLVNMPLVSEPFSRVAIDLIGPISPVSNNGHRYILTIIDYATRYPEAVPLKAIDTITIAESLVEVFSRVGIPREIMSDNGSQFKSDLMQEINRLLSVKAVHSTPYHAASNGCVERLNGTLKSMLKKACSEHPKDWDRCIPAILFAYREVPNDTLGFSPFELLYGKNVRGPLSILHELITNEALDNELRNSYLYVLELRERLEEAAEIALANAKVSAKKYKQYFDSRAKPRSLSVGDEVLLLLPSSTNKLLMQWKGPYEVKERRGNVDYVINVNGKLKLFHINMLKKFHRRDEAQSTVSEPDPECVLVQSVTTGLIEMEEGSEDGLVLVNDGLPQTCNIHPGLTREQREELKSLVEEFSDVFSDVPGKTETVVHEITLLSKAPVHRKPYPVPDHLRGVMEEEVGRMLEMGIIEPSSSPYCSPVVLVKKRDGSYRLCIDYRGLNDVTMFDAEPMPTRDDHLSDFVDDKYISELDLCRGYWQIPLHADSKVLTAFATSQGLMQFTRLPFGLKTACATFIRLMRKVLKGLTNTCCYFDNVVIHSRDWVTHVSDLRSVLGRLREHGLTAGPAKCFLGYESINYLGYSLGHNSIRPLEERVSAIKSIDLPTTKSQLRSFLGSVNFYRKFIPNVSSFTGPLSDMLRKNSPNQLPWTPALEEKFCHLRDALSEEPVLVLPDRNKNFILRTDASNTGVGAVLLQEVDNTLRPVSYASRKLLDRETRYSTIEKECLAVIWAMKHFDFYLKGKRFILQTDHQPLTYLRNMQNNNGRLMRWALTLQSYDFSVEFIPGKENVLSDLLSRP